MVAEIQTVMRETLERFKEAHPDLNSITKITAFKEDDFVQQYGHDLIGGEREARQIYRTAVNLQEKAILMWGNIKDAVSPHFKQTLFNNLPQDLPAKFIEKQESIPEYSKLFGNLDFIECDHYRSIFGPAAYFVDLMRFVEQNITQKNPKVAKNCTLKERRPDLARIRLDGDNTSDLIPYIDLVNELLEVFVKTASTAERDVYEVVAHEIFPISLPFHLPLTEIRSYLNQLKTSLVQIYQTFERPSKSQTSAANQTLITREILELSAEEFSLIISELSTEQNLSKHYGNVPLTGIQGLENVDVFLEQTGLTRKQLNELLFQDLDRHEVNAGLSRLFFINNVNDGKGYLTIAPNTQDPQKPYDHLLNLSNQKLDRIYRFVRLARKLDWSFADLDWALRSLGNPYTPETALQFDGINDYVACRAPQLNQNQKTFTIEAWINPSRSGKNVILSKGSESDQQLHFMVWITADNQLAFYGKPATGEPIQISSVYSIPTGVFTHIAVVVTEQAIQLYINGKPDQKEVLAGRAIAAIGEDLRIGADLGDSYFAGMIKEVRVWNSVRTQEQIDGDRYRRFTQPAQRENLLGYWTLTETIDSTLTDLSTQGNHGTIAGNGLVTQPRWVACDLVLDPLLVSSPNQAVPVALPQPVPTELLLPAAADSPRRTALDLDGENDVLVIRNQKNWGLGRLDRWTLEFWFNPTQINSPREQLILTQGDREGGLSIYLFQKHVYVLRWSNNLKGDAFQSALYKSTDLINDHTWYHLAITHNEFPASATKPLPVGVVESQVYLWDGTTPKTAPVQVPAGLRLSPVGAVCLGGLAEGQVTRFEDRYIPKDTKDQYFFAGQVTDLRLWKTARSAREIERDRPLAPTITPDLIAYFPLDEGSGSSDPNGRTEWLVKDYAGAQHDNEFRGSLQNRQIALETTKNDAALKNLYSHYSKEGALDWKNYFYQGRMRIAADGAAVGVTFLSRYPENKNQYYRLGCDATQPKFHLSAHPEKVQTLKSTDSERNTTVSGVQPVPNTWYHFLIRVEDREDTDQTLIQAKVWQDGTTEPTDFQLSASDDNPDIRLKTGTVGVWSTGSSTGSRQFDNLRVWSTSIAKPTPADLKLDINFETKSQMPEPENWSDRGDRIQPIGSDRLFRRIPVSGIPGSLVLGTDSTLNNIHSHYSPATVRVMEWKDYIYEGRIRITDANSGIGVTVLSQYPNGMDQYYALKRDREHPAFYLTANPQGVQPLRSLSDTQDQIVSTVIPEVNIWYRFSIQVTSNQTENRTEIRAKVWQEGAAEPTGFQMAACDRSSIRLQTGTVGIWASGSGTKYFDQLRVIDFLLAENFQASTQLPPKWRGTGRDNTFDEAPNLFEIRQAAGISALATESRGKDIHAHYDLPEALNWNDYVFTGKFLATLLPGENIREVGIGVCFFSQFVSGATETNYYRDLKHDRYHKLRWDGSNQRFVLLPHPWPDKKVEETQNLTRNFPFLADTWYCFLIEAKGTGSRTTIRTKVWQDGTPEPTQFQIIAHDDGTPPTPKNARLTAGTIGFWGSEKGSKYLADVKVSRNILPQDYEPQQWSETAARDRHQVDESLFRAVDTQANQLRWSQGDARFPLFQRPLNPTALPLNGQQYLTGQFQQALNLTQLTIEAWVKPTRIPTPILSLSGSSNGEATSLEFGIDATGKLTLITAGAPLVGSTVIATAQFTHVAVQIQNKRVTFMVNGVPEAIALADLAEDFSLNATDLEIGRTGGETDTSFVGLIKEVRLWNGGRTTEQIARGRFQRPEASPALVGYWVLGDLKDGRVSDRSSQGNALKLETILPEFPRSIGITLPDTGFWRSQRKVLSFDGNQTVRYPAPVSSTTPSTTDSTTPTTTGSTTTAAPAEVEPCQQRTIEVWFQVNDKTISHRKQVIYQEGNDQQGLLLYVYDSELYFVGYNTPDQGDQWTVEQESNWWITPVSLQRVWRLKTDRIESGRWHHAAIALDGRDELRPQSIKGYLDGKLVTVGEGSQLSQKSAQFTLGGVAGPVQFHDGASKDEPGHHLHGRILLLRIWTGVRTAAEIFANRATDLDGTASGLDLLWHLDQASGINISDQSANNRNGQFTDASQLQTLRQSLYALPVYALNPVALDATALDGLAQIKRLKQDHNLAIDRLTALWSPLKYTGREDGTTLFDQVFNLGGEVQPWTYHLAQPIRWDITGQENPNRDRQIQARLMGALKVSSEELVTLVAYLSGVETIIDLDTAYLTSLYRLTQLPKLLGITGIELLLLLNFMQQTSVDTLADVLKLVERAEWMQRSQITVVDLVFFAQDVKKNAAVFSEANLRNLAKQLRDEARDILVSGESFTTTVINQSQSLNIFKFLQDQQWVAVINPVELADLSLLQKRVQAIAAVNISDPSTLDLNGLLANLANTEGWMREFDTLRAEFERIRPGLGDSVLAALQTEGLIADNGQVLSTIDLSDNKLLRPLPASDRTNATILNKRARIRAVLEQRAELQEQIKATVLDTLTRLQAALSEAISQGLTEMLGVSTDLLQEAIAYLNQQSPQTSIDDVAFIKQIYTIQGPDSPVPAELSLYVAKLVKILYLLAKFEFSAPEARTFLQKPELLLKPDPDKIALVLDDLLQPTLPNLDRLSRFQQFKATLKAKETEEADGAEAATSASEPDQRLIDLLSLGAIDQTQLSVDHPFIKQLGDLTSWEPRQIITLATYLGEGNPNQIETLSWLQSCFELAHSLRVDIAFLLQLSDTSQFGSTNDFALYRQQADALLKVLRSHYNDEDWNRAYQPIRDQLAVQRRNALLALAMKKLGPQFKGRKDADILYEYFLLDMQVGSEVETSRIVQATASLQLYVQRCLMNLEAEVDATTIPLAEWEWVKNYRVWEANRKVFLYPENYIEPELRRTKTAQFQELEQELLQADIAQESVEAAYIHYLDKFAELAKLRIVGSYFHRELPGDSNYDPKRKPEQQDETLLVVGRTSSEPRIYYMRKRVKNAQGERWLPWEKIDLAINADFVTPVYAFGKWILFWTEFTKLKQSKDRRLSQRIRDAYTVDELKSVFADPQITVADMQAIDELARYTNAAASGGFTLTERNAIANRIRTDGHFKSLLGEYVNYRRGGRYLKTNDPIARDGTSQLTSFRADLAKAVKQVSARRALEAELTKEEIARLERTQWALDPSKGEKEWTIDSEHYLYDNRMGRVQELVDFWKATVKYSYYNFGKTWVPPQTYRALDLELSEEEYRKPTWHALYAQRAFSISNSPQLTTPAQPQQDPNPDVLEISEQTRLSVFLPPFNMANLTWSFWVNFINVNPQGFKGSLATTDDPLVDRKLVTQEELTRSLTLLNYHNGSLKITATNNVTAIAGAQQREDDTRTAVEKVQAALDEIRAADGTSDAVKESKFDAAKARLGEIPTSITLTQITEAKTKTNTAVNAPGEATNKRTEATNKRTEATNKRTEATNKRTEATNKDAIAQTVKEIADRLPEDNNYKTKLGEEAKKLEDQATAQETAKSPEAPLTRAKATKVRELANLATPQKNNLTGAEATLKSEATTLRNQATTLETDAQALETAATNLDNEAANLLSTSRTEAKTAVETALTAVQEQLKTEVEQPKWESKTITLKVQLGNEERAFSLDATGTWQYVALTLAKNPSGYRVDVYRAKAGDTTLTTVVNNQTLAGASLEQGKLLEIGQQPTENSIFTTQMAEFQHWNQVKTDLPTIWKNRGSVQDGLFSLPLNRWVPNSSIRLVKSQGLTLTLPIAFQGDLPDRLRQRERIIIFYGDQVKSIRDTLQEQSFNLTLDRGTNLTVQDVQLTRYKPSSGAPEVALRLTQTGGLSLNDFAVSGQNQNLVVSASALPEESNASKLLIRKLGTREASLVDVYNRPGWYIANVGDEQFLVKARFLNASDQELPVPTAAELMQGNFDDTANTTSGNAPAVKVSFNIQRNQAPVVDAVPANKVQFQFERLNTYAVYKLSQKLFTGGIDEMISPESQAEKELDFWTNYDPNTTLVPRNLNPLPPTIDFQGNYRLYYEEIFFHIPFLIANQLNANQKFAEAQQWYHYLFNPTAQAPSGSSNQHYWQYLPFRNLSSTTLKNLLTNSEALAVYREDPFDPHAIAALRPTAYQKAVVMKYIDNLLDWGDSLFTQDTRESINEAAMLYVLAFNLLGPKPKSKSVRQLEEIGNYDDFVRNRTDAIEFLTQEEMTPTSSTGTTVSPNPYSTLLTNFSVPENEKFIGYWDRVEDRLYKIRHSQNIEGIFRQLSLFQPPIDPAALVRAVAAGLGVSGGLADMSVGVPHYRYGKVLERAQDIVSMVTDLGSALLSAIESKEDGQLSALEHTHARNILTLTTKLKEYEISQAKEEIQALTSSEQNIQYRYDHFVNLRKTPRSPAEQAGKAFASLALLTIVPKQVFATLGELMEAFPDANTGASGVGGSPVITFEWGGENAGAAFKGTKEALDGVASVFAATAALCDKEGEYLRRDEEWLLEEKTAECDLKEIQKQIAMANLRLQLAQEDLSVHKKEMQQHQEIADFHRSKFTNAELRNWMVGKLTGLYFQAYNLAYNLAKAAEKGLQFELPTTQVFITPGHWDSLRKGLLAGESLALELGRMHKVHLDQDSRFQDIQKTISMNRTFPEALAVLRQTGACEFTLSERLFDRDFPGHYCRMVKAIAISIEAETEINAYDGVNATLIQTSNKTLLVPDSNAVSYLLGTSDTQPDFNTLRVNWRANQQIAVSRPSEDYGMHADLDFFFDDRYFPFEGTGAVSSWRFELPLENNPSLVDGGTRRLRITDVVIHLKYTSKVDRGSFKQQVQALMK